MSKLINVLKHLFMLRNAALSIQEESMKMKAKIENGGGHVGNHFDLINSSIDLIFPYLISIGDNVTLSGVKILTHDATLKKSIGYTKVGKVTIGDNVFVGWGSIILMNTTIGNNVVIGAGSIVTGHIPDNSVAVGNPCRVICSYDEYKRKMLTKMQQVPVFDKYPKEINRSPEDVERLKQAGYGFIL